MPLFSAPKYNTTTTSSSTNTANNLHSGLLLLVEEEEVEEDVGAVGATNCLLVVAEGDERLPSINDYCSNSASSSSSSFVICKARVC